MSAARWLAVVAGAAGCSLVVPSELDAIRCSPDGAVGPPACLDGQLCARGACRLCLGAETCGDGVDDDCDGVIDQGCSDGGGAAGGAAGSDGSGGGAAGSTPDASDGSQEAAPPGGSCPPSGACGPGLFCADLGALYGEGAAICTRSCCRSEDCGPGPAVCWPTPFGGGLCRLAVDLGRPGPGAAPAGAPCGGGADCRSGTCDRGTCGDTCCGHGDCGGAAPDCRVRSVEAGREAFVCGDAPSKLVYGTACTADDECRSGLCMGSQFVGACSQACCSDADCGAVAVLGELGCHYVPVGGGNFVRACTTGRKGPGAAGDPCGGNDDCRGGRCIRGRCADACCDDASCGRADLGCRPVESASAFVLRCAPR